MAAILGAVITVATVVACAGPVAGSLGPMNMEMEEKNEVILGQTIHLDCSWSNDDEDINDKVDVKWFFKGELIETNAGKPKKYRITIGERKSSLQINEVNRLDQGNYTCVVGYDEHWASAVYELDLHLPPEISFRPTDMPHVGDYTEMICKTVGKPNSNIQWGFENHLGKFYPLQYLNTFLRTYIRPSSNKTGAFLTVGLNPVTDQTGRYFCESERKTEYANLTVKGIDIDCGPKLASVMIGGTAYFQCVIKSVVPVNTNYIKWKKKTPTGGTEVILPTDRKFVTGFDNYKGSRIVNAHLEVHDVNVKDAEIVFELHVQTYAALFSEKWEANTDVRLEIGDESEEDGVSGPNEKDDESEDKVVVVNHTSVAAIVGVSVGTLALIVLVIVAFICYKKRRKAKKQNQSRFDPNYIYQYEYHGEANTHTQNPTFLNPGYQVPPPKMSLRKENTYVSTVERERLEFPRDKLQLGVDLGEGRFGKVIQGRAMNITGTGNWVQVAVKTCRSTATDSEKHDLYQELEIMRKIPSHPNIVALYGCCSKIDPLYIIMEYVQRGSMLSYLRKCRPTSRMSRDSIMSESTVSSSFMQPRAKDLTIFALQIARGMAHVANIGIIHRDLAVRNVLLATDFTCKICDFGLARDVEGIDVYERTSKGPLPIRWMAPESLEHNLYTKKSDVWSYGVTLWEIVTLGATPYQGMSAMEVMRQVLQGFYLPQPLHCKEEMYELMIKCWEKPELRPSFAEIVTHFEALMDDDYIILSEYDESDYQWLDSYTLDERV